jgi:hypothetical protein
MRGLVTVNFRNGTLSDYTLGTFSQMNVINSTDAFDPTIGQAGIRVPRVSYDCELEDFQLAPTTVLFDTELKRISVTKHKRCGFSKHTRQI